MQKETESGLRVDSRKEEREEPEEVAGKDGERKEGKNKK